MVLFCLYNGSMQTDTDEEYMNEALRLASLAGRKGEVPVGCVIVKDDKIIGRGYNQREEKHCIVSHAEIEAITEAEKTLGNWRLDHCVMYVTLEPCLMCAGAILQSRISRLVYGAADSSDGAITSRYRVYDEPSCHPRPLVTIGIKSEQCQALLSAFFSQTRKPL